jgi:hypothetical protein
MRLKCNVCNRYSALGRLLLARNFFIRAAWEYIIYIRSQALGVRLTGRLMVNGPSSEIFIFNNEPTISKRAAISAKILRRPKSERIRLLSILPRVIEGRLVFITQTLGGGTL